MAFSTCNFLLNFRFQIFGKFSLNFSIILISSMYYYRMNITKRSEAHMKRRAFLQNKLWRDKAVEKMHEMQSIIHWKYLDDAEYDYQLRQKLLEEAREVCFASSHKELMQELADVLEIIEAISVANEISFEKLRSIQLKKREDRGGFEGRKFVTIAEHLEGSFGEKYCLADPEKYPEITEAITPSSSN